LAVIEVTASIFMGVDRHLVSIVERPAIGHHPTIAAANRAALESSFTNPTHFLLEQ
jgi:hypothetical protein